jgi:DNA repair exonuclease SbcCD ATPase subunit
MSVRLRRLELEGFRGFAEHQAIDLDADAVVIRGDNGSGKTSLVDGLLWLYTGELAHLVERVRGLRRTEDAVKSRFNPYGATVSLTVAIDGVDHVFTRTGDQRTTHLTAHTGDSFPDEGEAAEERLAAAFGTAGKTQLRQAVLTWGLLRQDSIRAALDETGGALHERLSGLIGLERVSTFATATSRASEGLVRQRTAARTTRDAAARRHEEAVSRLHAARQAAGSAQDVDRLLSEGLATLVDDARGVVTSRLPADRGLSAIAELGATVGRIVETLSSLQDRQRTLAQYPDDPQPLVHAAEEAVQMAERAATESAERAPALIGLATSAMRLLGERCPVCQQTIDTSSVRAHLEEVLARSEALVADAQACQDALVRARAELARVRGMLAERRIAAEEVEASQVTLGSLLADAEAWLEITPGELDPPTVDALHATLSSFLSGLRELYRTVNQASGAEVARLADQANEAARALQAADQEIAELEARCERAKSLEKAAHQAAQMILADALEKLQPSFAEVFDRLSPNPAFTELLARQDVMRNRNQILPIVRDRERGIEANPLLVFSEGQLNVVALSYFLGMALNARDAALPFLVLDDPLQALDVIATLGFSDLCRQIRDRRQLLVTTHDRRFADVLVRKLSPRDTGQSLLVHDLQGWTRDGPVIHTELPELQPVMWLLRGQAS